MAPLDFASFLELALRLLARQAPRCYARLAEAAGGDAVRIAVDGPPLRVHFASGRHRIECDAAAPLEVRTDRATILALVEGELSLLDAILAERLWLQGSVDAVLRFDAVLLAFLDGAVRAPSFPALLEAFRGENHSVERRWPPE